MTRPGSASILALLLMAATALPVAAQYTTKNVVEGFTKPVYATTPPGLTEPLFVVEQRGTIRRVDDGVIQGTHFLDIQSTVHEASQYGLLGFAFHPDYFTNGYVYVHIRTSSTEALVLRYRSRDPASYSINLASARLIVQITSGVEFHQGGGQAFGPDDKLYVGVGDLRALAGTCGAQDGSTLVGKILRLEDDGTIPSDNPFVGDPTVLDEIWMLGVRQPYRMSFDSLTGDLWIGDVGENAREEVSFFAGGGVGGENLGWPLMEGNQCSGLPLCVGLPCPDAGYVDPIHDYSAGGLACVVIGGLVYRGARIPSLQGAYLFTDYCSGEFWAMRQVGGVMTELTEISADLVPFNGDPPAGRVTAVATDGTGEVLLVDYGFGVSGLGRVMRLLGHPYDDLGNALAGTAGEPDLGAEGSLVAPDLMTLSLTNALPSGSAYLVLGFSNLSAPFKLGVLVPSFDILLSNLPIDASGELTFSFPWPPGLPVGLEMYWQYWIPDAGAPAGFAASNGLLSTQP